MHTTPTFLCLSEAATTEMLTQNAALLCVNSRVQNRTNWWLLPEWITPSSVTKMCICTHTHTSHTNLMQMINSIGVFPVFHIFSKNHKEKTHARTHTYTRTILGIEQLICRASYSVRIGERIQISKQVEPGRHVFRSNWRSYINTHTHTHANVKQKGVAM